jgi:hypothetical protein
LIVWEAGAMDIRGTARIDTLVGTRIEDRIYGLENHDSLYGDGLLNLEGRTAPSPEPVTGSAGAAATTGSSVTRTSRVTFGDGVLRGGSDHLRGDLGDDVLYGDGEIRVAGRNPDSFTIALIGGNDLLAGGAGRDYLCGDGFVKSVTVKPVLTGGDDALRGGADDDTVLGDGVAFFLLGGDDRLFGEQGA